MTKPELIARALAALDEGCEVTFSEDFIIPTYLDEYNRYTLGRRGRRFHAERVKSDNDAANIPTTTHDDYDRAGLEEWLGRFDDDILADIYVRVRDGKYVALPKFAPRG